MNEYLPPTELHALTGYARPGAQAAWLKDHAVPHKVDGKRIIVSRVHVQAWIEGKIVASGGVNFAAVR
jgi:hypothetical protein